MLGFDVMSNYQILHFHLELLVLLKLIKAICTLKHALVHYLREHALKIFNIISHLTDLVIIEEALQTDTDMTYLT